MKNFEKFEKEIMECLRNSSKVAVVDGKPIKCEFVDRCSSCFFNGRCCQFELFKWLYSEYVEPPKLTKQERKFCELLEGKDCWFARDLDGSLTLFVFKPEKDVMDGAWWADDFGVGAAIMTEDELPVFEIKMSFIKWEDEEPWSVAELLKMEVE